MDFRYKKMNVIKKILIEEGEIKQYELLYHERCTGI